MRSKQAKWKSAIGAGALAGLLITGSAGGRDEPSVPTFHKEVERILQKNCQPCHRPGGDNYTGMVAPMSLVTYEDVRPWAKSIAKETTQKDMPPWFAGQEFHGVFSNERGLTKAEIDIIARWVSGGARKGEIADAPSPRVFPDWGGWRIGVPDLVVKAERFFVNDDVEDKYVTLTGKITADVMPEDRWVAAIEWKGGSNVVHHIVGFYAATGPDGKMVREGLGSIAPGEEAMILPDGHARMLRKGATIIFSMHYHKEPGAGTGKWDESAVAFKFLPKDKLPRYFVHQDAIGFSDFELPPGHPNWKISTARTFEKDTFLLKMHPHMHLRGKDAKYVAFYPDGRTETLLYVPKWNFNWQTDYSLKEPKLLPAGTRIEYTAHFDNSKGNAANPNPSIPIRWGQATTDEMMLGYVTYCDAAPIQHPQTGVTQSQNRAAANPDRK